MIKTGSKLASLRALARDAETRRLAACQYLEELSKELAEIAYENGLDTLAIIFEMAREDAERIRQASDKHLRQS